jgi:hypothetical protein
LTPFTLDFSRHLDAVEERIMRAVAQSGRQRADITLVAVSKKFSASALQVAYQAGLRHFGENYVQEFAQKNLELRELTEARYHLIGHLQSNKARPAVSLFDTIHTVDSVKLLQRLDAAAAEAGKSLEALIELKLSGEETKTGAPERDIPAIVEAAAVCARVRVTGLMTMPPWSTDAETARPFFQRLAGLGRQFHLSQLSMGMSNDFEVAIEEGATIIRVGTALFGPRPKPV